MSGPHWDLGSVPGATLIFLAASATPETTSSNAPCCTYRREPALQHWPWLKKVAFAAPATAASMSASAKTTLGDLQPSSSVTFLRLPAAALTISLPTSVEPVKA